MDILLEKTKRAILCWCIEDWTPLFSVFSFVGQYYCFYRHRDLKLIKIKTFETIKDLLDNELVIAGELCNDNVFYPWNKSPEKTLLRIKKEWDNLDRKLRPHEIVWFDITKKGEKEFEHLNSLPELRDTNPFYYDVDELTSPKMLRL